MIYKYRIMSSKFQKDKLCKQSFKNKNLTGEDFSGLDITGVNFYGAILTNTNFSKSKAGIAPITLFILIIVITFFLFFIGIVIGYGSAFPILINNLLSLVETSKLLANILLIAGFIILVGFLIIILRQGIGISLGIWVIIFASITGLIGFAGTGELLAIAWVQAIMISIAVASILISSLAISVLLAVVSNYKWLFLPTIILITGIAIGVVEGVEKPSDVRVGFSISVDLLITGITAIIFLCLSIYVAIRALKEDRKYRPIYTLMINLCTALGTNFRHANLTDADFSYANIVYTDFRNTSIKRTNWFNVTGLERSRIEGTYLANENIRQLVISKNGQNGIYNNENLQGLNLQNAILENASFIGANLSESNLNGADLTNAKLAKAQFYATDLTGSCLTRTCIQDWAISTDTKLENIKCDEIYMRLPTEDDLNPWRKPDKINQTFKDGDFTDFIAPIIKTLDLYQQQNIDPREVGKSLKTLDIYHYGELNSVAATIALTELAQKYPDAGLEIVALEGRGQEKIHLQAIITGQGDSSKLNAEYTNKYDEISSLPQQEIQKLMAILVEKDAHIHSLEKILATPKESDNVYYIQVGRDISGVLNFGNITGNITNTKAES